MQLTISDRIADEIREWAVAERDYWPDDTVYQRDLDFLLKQLDSALPAAEDVRGIMST